MRVETETENYLNREGRFIDGDCQVVVTEMAKGKFLPEVCAVLGITTKTFHQYRHKKPGFELAYEMGKMLNYCWWLNKARENLCTKDFNNALWYSIMRNLHGLNDQSVQRAKEFKKFGSASGIQDKIRILGAMLEKAEICPHEYAVLMGALKDEANIIEIVEIQVKLARFEFDQQLAKGEITKEQYDQLTARKEMLAVEIAEHAEKQATEKVKKRQKYSRAKGTCAAIRKKLK